MAKKGKMDLGFRIKKLLKSRELYPWALSPILFLYIELIIFYMLYNLLNGSVYCLSLIGQGSVSLLFADVALGPRAESGKWKMHRTCVLNEQHHSNTVVRWLAKSLIANQNPELGLGTCN